MSGDKSEKPTGQRLDKARKEGNLPRSRELVTALLVLGGTITLSAFSENLGRLLTGSMRYNLALSKQEVFDPQLAFKHLGESLSAMGWTLLAPLGLLMLIALVGNLLRGGWNVSIDSLQPKFSKLNPISGMGRMFSSQSIAELVKSVLKTALISLTLWSVVGDKIQMLLSLQHRDIGTAITLTLDLIWSTVLLYGLALLFIALLDLPYTQWQYIKKLKMSKQEVKEEHKNSEGNPQIKSRIRNLQRQMAMRRMHKVIPQADVIITNPTHYAVALKYDQNKAEAPFVLAKAVDAMALQMQQLARQHNRPIVNVPPLTRAVYYSTKEWQEIPAGLYTAVAHILTYVFHLEEYRLGRGLPPPPLPELTIPPELRH